MSDDDVLAGLESQYNNSREGLAPKVIDEHINDIVIEDEPVIENDDEPEQLAADDKTPPGFKTYEEWIEDGRDPDDYRGKKAYSEQYDLLQANRQTTKDLKEMKDTLKLTADAVGEWKEGQQQQIRAEIQGELETAKENDNIDAALDAQGRLNELDAKPAPAEKQTVNPLVTDFIDDNPILNDSSDAYNPMAMNQMQRIYNNKLKMLDDGTGQFSDADIKSCLKAAMVDVKGLNPDLFESPRNNRQPGIKPKASRTPTTQTPTQTLNNVKIERSNPRDTNAAQELFDMINAKDPKAAERFANAVGGKS